MQTVNEVVRDVLANPEAYTDAFPVAEPEQMLMPFFNPETATLTMSGVSELVNGDSLTPEMMEEVRRRMLSSSYSREPRGLRTFWDGNARFIPDESHPRDRVTMVNVPLREDSVADRIRRGEWRRRSYYGDGLASRDWEDRVRRMAALTAIDDPSRGMADQPIPGTDYATATGLAIAEANEQVRMADQPAIPYYGEGVEQAARRPDHYRVSPGRCQCGFTSMFTGDMIDHIGGRVLIANNHQWTWRLCECGASALCHQVAEPAYLGLDFATHQPTMRTNHIYLCDACCQRRGIR